MKSITKPRWPGPRSALGIALLLVGSGCGEDASPTVPAPVPAPPPPMETRVPPAAVEAKEVVDRDSLRLFVEEAARIASADIAAEDPADAVFEYFDATFRPEGLWRQGEIYLFVIDLDGQAVFHAVTPELEGTDLSDLTDVDGVRIIEELLAAAAAGGGYVEYQWPNPAVAGDEETGSPKVSYAVEVTLGGRDLMIGSGIYPPVTAADVRNRGTLFSFVERAAMVLAENAPDLESAYAYLDANFRMDGEWRQGPIYVFVQTMDLVSFFHATQPEIEGLDRSATEDINGVMITQAIRAAAEAGGDFVEYWYDNPAVEGDEETGSPKTAYATIVTIGSTPLTIGSGIYLQEPEGN